MQGTKGTGANPSSSLLDAISQQLFNIWAPTQKKAAGAATDLLTTGGTGTTVPLIANLIQNLRSGLSRTMVDTQGRLGMARQAGTPFGQRILAETQREGQSEIAGAGPQVGMEFLKTLLGMSTGGAGQAVSGLSATSAANAGVLESQNRAYGDIMSAMIPRTSVGMSYSK